MQRLTCRSKHSRVRQSENRNRQVLRDVTTPLHGCLLD